jgi:tRNA(Ile)-lysidine synthase
MTFTIRSFHERLHALVPREATGLLVAFSGGLDSTVLLHSAAQLRSQLPWPLRAIHVNHQIHADAACWAEHCEAVAAGLGVPFACATVHLANIRSHGIEAAAREARYAALRSHLRAGEVLLTAHHADDQAETLLLALVRGTGVRGLAGMPALQRFGTGWHARPLLDVRRAALEAWAREQSLRWIEDPSNESVRFARNFLRSELVPRLQARWPRAVEHLGETAATLGEAAELLDELAALDCSRYAVDGCLDVQALATLSAPRARNLLRWWLRAHGARPPSRAHLAALCVTVERAAPDRVPYVDVDGLRIYRYRDLLYAVPHGRLTKPQPQRWNWHEPLDVEVGRLRALPTHGAGLARARLPEFLEVRFRIGGERLQPARGAPRRTLKNLLQEADVLPWWRERLPLLYSGERLCAVADLWVDASMRAAPDEAGVNIVWDNRPAIFAVTKQSRH